MVHHQHAQPAAGGLGGLAAAAWLPRAVPPRSRQETCQHHISACPPSEPNIIPRRPRDLCFLPGQPLGSPEPIQPCGHVCAEPIASNPPSLSEVLSRLPARNNGPQHWWRCREPTLRITAELPVTRSFTFTVPNGEPLPTFRPSFPREASLLAFFSKARQQRLQECRQPSSHAPHAARGGASGLHKSQQG